MARMKYVTVVKKGEVKLGQTGLSEFVRKPEEVYDYNGIEGTQPFY